ncbi:DSD1 family PLP-dependent enzyme [Salinisphaera shabanensis]|nr:DSD1 family PLP-dependent enzyme [Salinisphaera shabanensis]
MAFNIPAEVGMHITAVDTPCLLVDIDALEANIAYLADFAQRAGVRLRPHAKSHKSADIAARQLAQGAVGLCCQTVSEAEAMVHAGVRDVLVSNEVVAPRMIDRLAALAGDARVIVCADDADNVAALEAAAARFATRLDLLVEMDVGAGRCGLAPGEPACKLARSIAACTNLRFAGLQAYHGPAQHIRDHAERRAAIDAVVGLTRDTVERLAREGLTCEIVAGAGTGSFDMEAASGVYNELQCGSYVFLDADYARVAATNGAGLPFRHSLFVLARVISKTRAGRAVCDAGLKSHSVDSGLPTVFDRPGVTYTGASDEHGQLDDPRDTLTLGDTLRLVPGHCDPTVNMHDWLVGFRGDRVVALWPVTARGMSL